MTRRPEIWLSLDMSSPMGTLALHEGGTGAPRLIVESELGEGHQHTERVLDALRRTLEGAGLRFDQVTRYLTGTGPGSFTGLRIAFATLKAFAMARSLPLETLSGAEARALSWPGTARSLYVLTSVAPGRFVRSEFGSDRGLVSETVETVLEASAGTVLLDGRIPTDFSRPGLTIETFALRARHLAEALPRATSRRTASTVEEWVAASPQYFGARH